MPRDEPSNAGVVVGDNYESARFRVHPATSSSFFTRDPRGGRPKRNSYRVPGPGPLGTEISAAGASTIPYDPVSTCQIRVRLDPDESFHRERPTSRPSRLLATPCGSLRPVRARGAQQARPTASIGAAQFRSGSARARLRRCRAREAAGASAPPVNLRVQLRDPLVGGLRRRVSSLKPINAPTREEHRGHAF
jgi:hypothetical protein